MSGYSSSMTVATVQWLYITAGSKTLNTQPRKNSKGRLASGFERLVHSLMILNAFANPNSTQPK